MLKQLIFIAYLYIVLTPFNRELLHPDKEALIDGNRRLTYRELNQRVNRLANALSARGQGYGE